MRSQHSLPASRARTAISAQQSPKGGSFFTPRLFLEHAARNLGRPAPRLAPEVEQRLMSHPWPGNVRELENMMDRVAILAEAQVEPSDLPFSEKDLTRPIKFKDSERHRTATATNYPFSDVIIVRRSAYAR